MKRFFVLLAMVIILAGIAILFAAIVLSFKVVRKNTDNINKSLKDQLKNIVSIPPPIPPESKTFYTTTYIWEMETNQGEITRVKFSHDTLFDKKLDKFTATLEMEPGQDPSLFNKVLPAVITDIQAYQSVTNLKNPSLEKNDLVGYEKLTLLGVQGREDQVAKIVWEFPKDKFITENDQYYRKLYTLPNPVLKGLYSLQRIIIEIFSA